MMQALRFSMLSLMVTLAIACSGDDDGDEPGPSPTTAAPTSTSVSEPTATPSSTPPPLPTAPDPGIAVAKTVWLVDAGAGTSTTLAEDHESFALSARFSLDGDRIQVARDLQINEYDLAGGEIGPAPGVSEQCTYIERAEEIDGRWHPSLNCEESSAVPNPFLSPDGVWFTYRLDVSDRFVPPAFPPVSEMWALNAVTGERHLLHEMQDCGGCDGRFGPSWSPSGRFYVFGETGGEGRVFLSDMQALSTRVIANGNEVVDEPQWAPEEDLLTYRAPDGAAVVEDVSSGTSRQAEGLVWPAAFDPSGQYIYSPAFGANTGDRESQATLVFPVATLDAPVRLDGVPDALNLWRRSVAIHGDPVIKAALVDASGCDGTRIYADGDEVVCIEGGQAANVSPDGTKVALARLTGQTGPVPYPGGGSVSLNVFDIVIVDVGSGDETVVGTDAISDQPPLLTWNTTSSHLLVEWPVHSGL
jgi:hypothetical protein